MNWLRVLTLMASSAASLLPVAVCLALYVVLTGCAASPYLDVGVGYQIDSASSWTVQTDRPWQCSDNLQARFAVGLDWGRTELEYLHQSWVACGSPFNSRNEQWSDTINLKYRFGGQP